MTKRSAKTLEERVQALEAEWEIRNLVATYLLKADIRDVEGYAETFAEDGVLDIAGLHFDKVGMEVPSTHVGRDAIGKAYSQYIAPMPCFMWHLGHTPYIEINGSSATGRWGWTALVNIPGIGPMQAGGVYHDDYVQTDAGWKIKKRMITSWYSMEYGKWNEDMFFGLSQ